MQYTQKRQFHEKDRLEPPTKYEIDVADYVSKLAKLKHDVDNMNSQTLELILMPVLTAVTATLIAIIHFHVMQGIPRQDASNAILEERMRKIEILLKAIVEANAVEEMQAK